jgi:hypothetical protein
MCYTCRNVLYMYKVAHILHDTYVFMCIYIETHARARAHTHTHTHTHTHQVF